MKTRRITLRFIVTPRRIVCALLFILFFAAPENGGTSDPSTLSVYYPSPAGFYGTLSVDGKTVLGRDSGMVRLSSYSGAKVLIGNTLPAAEKVRVYGTLRVDGCIWLAPQYRCAW